MQMVFVVLEIVVIKISVSVRPIQERMSFIHYFWRLPADRLPAIFISMNNLNIVFATSRCILQTKGFSFLNNL